MQSLRYLRDVVTLALDSEKCCGCAMCTVVCPHAVLAINNGHASIVDRDACMECGACARNCPTQAISVQAGVGCAAAVINKALGRAGDCCCTIDSYSASEEICASAESSRTCC